MQTVSFTAMKDGTREDYLMLRDMELKHNLATADRLLREMARQEEETIEGYQISRLGHALQSATRARREGADVDWIVSALLHDIGDGLAPQNHDRMAAEIIRPFVREECTWVVEHHGAFQMIYYAHHYGWNREERARYADSPHYQACVDFCERWDQSCFDPAYEADPLDSFAPTVRDVFSRKAYAPDVVRPGVAIGLLR
ncbi:HD domain-containing protein [Acidisphaera sp. L21]|uniref:HD domain-containing protein n=1 Tax=Acidisphaera sp. L21 TaxID=1641851 RepID=UPI001C207ED8|nr:HD domain-containing protein [Acidisphaera sp. L21]